MNYCIECKNFHYNTSKKAFECSSGIVRISEIPCDTYVEDSMVWVKMLRSHGRLIDATELLKTVEELRDEPRLTYTQFSDGVLKNIKSAPTVLEAST